MGALVKIKGLEQWRKMTGNFEIINQSKGGLIWVAPFFHFLRHGPRSCPVFTLPGLPLQFVAFVGNFRAHNNDLNRSLLELAENINHTKKPILIGYRLK